MNEFVTEFLPNILAGLFPTLVLAIPSFRLIFKNLKVNKSVDDMQKTLITFLKGEESLKGTLDKTVKFIEDFQNDTFKEIKSLIDDLKDAARNDIEALEESFNQRLKDQEHLYHNQIQRLKAKGADIDVEDVSSL